MMERFIQIDETVRFEVSFSVLNRERRLRRLHPLRHRRYGSAGYADV